MKQSLNAGTLDNISCIFICLNNFKQILQNKFYENQTKNNYTSAIEILNNNSNIDEIRKRLAHVKENSIQMKENEFIKFGNFDNNFEKKPKTSSEAIKSRSEYIDLLKETNGNEHDFYTNNTDNQSDDEKYLYKIISKKNKTPFAPYKNYESNLPSFKISQKMSRLPKEINLKVSPTNKFYTNNIVFNSNNANVSNQNFNTNMNMNFTSKNNRFLPSITKNLNSTNFSEKSTGFKFTKPNLNFNFNK